MSVREDFEKQWSHTNEEQGLHFVEGLNVYGCEFYANHEMAERKYSAWFWWQASRAALVVELPDSVANTGTLTSGAVLSYKRECREAIHASGITVKP